MKLIKVRPKQIIATVIIVSMIIITVVLPSVSYSAFAEPLEQTVKFESSFESEDAPMLESMLDGNRIKNVESVSDKGRMTGDLTYLVRSDTLAGTPAFKPEEDMHNLFDYNTGSKYLTGVKPSTNNPVEVILQLERSAPVVSYLIGSANDESGRDPAAWTLFGSKNGQNWTELDTRSGVSFSSRQDKKTFQFDNAVSYRYYKITITENKGAAMTQFSEFQLADRKQAGDGADVTHLVDTGTLSGSEDFKPEEGKAKLFDRDTYTKFLTNSKASSATPVIVAFGMKQPTPVGAYAIGAGPDELERNPKTWTFEGSTDGTGWTVLDRQSGIVFAREQEMRRFSFDNKTAYSHYRIVITQNNGHLMTQFSELQLFTAPDETGEPPASAEKESPSFDVTSLLAPESISGSLAVGESESLRKLFDYNTDSKYVSTMKGSAENPVEVSFRLSKICKITGYTIGSGNDEGGRDPKSWTLYGKNDGGNWTEIDSRTGITFESRQQLRNFTLDRWVEYDQFKLSVTENNGEPITQFSELRLTGILPGCATPYLISDSIDGSLDINAGEGKAKLFDYDTGSKFATRAVPADNAPVTVFFGLEQSFVIDTYIIGAGPDEPGRDPKSWKLYGSEDGDNWSILDSRSDESLGNRRSLRSFTFDNETPYQFYKVEISKTNGADITQFSELHLLGSRYEVLPKEYSSMKTRKSRGPAESFNTLTSTGWTGWSALEVLGKHTGNGEAYCYNVIYDNLSISVTEHTNLSYMFFPALYNSNEYDFDFTSQHMAVDLKFTDGTYLSTLSARDQNGTVVSPMAQGQAEILAYMQWNHIYSNIGAVATGKTIEQILIGYHKKDNPNSDGTVFMGYFDDIVIKDAVQEPYEHLSDYVNILRGTNNTLMYSRGITTPLVTMPHGFNAYAPMTESKSTLPYYYQLAGTKNTLRHMAVTHAASPWLGDWGTWQFMPNTSINYSTVTKGEDINADKRKAEFTHEKEEAKAHYYGVTFEEGSAASGVKMEVTPASHGMYARFSFPDSSENRNLIFDCEWADGGLTFHGDGSFTAYSDHIYGHGEYSPARVNGATRMYIYGVIDQEYTAAKSVNNKQGIISFGADTGTVTMKLATSFISEAQAKKNLSLEISNSDSFDSIFSKAQETWDDKLGVIEVEGATHDQMVTLYSGMYRMFAYPTLYAENIGTGQNPKWVHSNPYGGSLAQPDVKDGKMYTTNGFWDTYRSAWPAYAFLTPGMAGEMVDGLVQHYKDSGWVSRWLAPGAINCMLGTHADAIFGDAMVKGIQFDHESAFAASLKNSAVVTENLDKGGRIQTASAIFRGYTSTSAWEGYSWGIEDTVNDYNIYKMAEFLGKTDEAAYYKNRSMHYVNYFNPNLKWFMGRNNDGRFSYSTMDEFDPSAWHDRSRGDFCESNAWNMSFSAVQDVQGMANLYGGTEKAIERLDQLFNYDMRYSDIGQREAREVRLGQYNHTNQPSLHLTYMYSYLGKPYKTQELTRSVMARCYSGSSIGQGYLGDEDNGAMSAWYVMNALGFYTPSVGSSEYVIGSPLYKKATVHLENGKDLIINAPENSQENIYIQSVKRNNKAHDKVYFTHEELSAGGVIDFVMGSNPSNWGTGKNAAPSSLTAGSENPLPLADITLPGIKTGTVIDLTSTSIASKNINELSKLIDNTSDTVVTLAGSGKEIVYYNPQAKTVSMYTLTSGTDKSKAPAGFILYGSTDGKNWIELDSRSGEVFQWNKYTRPFTVTESKQAAYNYYKLAFSATSEIQLAEIELIGEEGKQTSKPTLELSPDTMDLEKGQSGQVAALLTPSDAGIILFSSSDDEIASVDQNGKVTANKAGTATITAVLTEDNTVKDTCVVTVTDSGVSVNKSDLQNLYDAHKDKQQGDYTNESWTVFRNAIEAAKNVLDSDSATQDEVDAALHSLQTAADVLKKNEPVSSEQSKQPEQSNTSKHSGISSLDTFKVSSDSSSKPSSSGSAGSVSEQGENPKAKDTFPAVPLLVMMIISAGGIWLTKRR